MSSGVRTNPECLQKYQELKLGKTLKYIIYKLNDDYTEIIVEKAVQNATYDEFLASLPENEPRYAVYDFDYEKSEGGQRNKIVFYSWNPDTSMIRHKMVYASSKISLRKQMDGVGIEIQGTDASEVDYESVLEKAQRSA
ncbi:hypothetical protein G6F16_000435 [Rhizopus arrhizus]|nr:hypothetical protein G6F23_009956 [Rhizopus arrhizus]KAG0757049.1 hypothetical protein G6F24_010744 [Rhizopus arrhizus]KAG0789947.1 hypothetical protein G6F22_006555 [Rhizopus arrhizus]KAG0796744.1 hypothetical protein G6F21_001077 [Rhizopus arrhizus]KAG0817571.1 hypothetical protein G6F20_002283 [Rhizopus arrhizus]